MNPNADFSVRVAVHAARCAWGALADAAGESGRPRKRARSARRALARAGIEQEGSTVLLNVVAARVAERRTGACWQLETLATLERHAPREAALRELVVRYLEHAASGRPMHEWPLDA